MPKKAKAAGALDLDAPIAFVKELPPASKDQDRKGEWMRRFEALMAKPKQWARVRVMASFKTAGTTANNLKRGKIKVPEGVFEAVARAAELDAEGMPKEGCKGLLFARYMGPGDKSKRTAGAARRGRRDSFYAWILQYKDEKEGSKGRIARHILNDPSWPTRGSGVGSVEYLIRHVKASLGAKLGYEVDWLNDSWEEYQKGGK